MKISKKIGMAILCLWQFSSLQGSTFTLNSNGLKAEKFDSYVAVSCTTMVQKDIDSVYITVSIDGGSEITLLKDAGWKNNPNDYKYLVNDNVSLFQGTSIKYYIKYKDIDGWHKADSASITGAGSSVELTNSVGCKLFPTIVTDYISVQSNFKAYEIQIYDAIGVMVFTKSGVSAEIETFKVAELPQGQYFVRLKGSDQQLFTTKIIKI